MARATSHGAAAAATTNTNHRRRHGSSLSPSPAGGTSRKNSTEEATGLLSPGAGADAEDDDDDSGSIVHPGEPDSRTPTRVRFDLRPTTITTTTTTSNNNDDDPYPRTSIDSFDFLDTDPLSSSHTPSASHRTHQQRVPLLTGIEAPSITVA